MGTAVDSLRQFNFLEAYGDRTCVRSLALDARLPFALAPVDTI